MKEIDLSGESAEYFALYELLSFSVLLKYI